MYNCRLIMSDLLSQLNPQQRIAVEITEGPVLVLAGAGSGKTRVITYRIAHLISSGCTGPQNILAVTFTNKAAAQMKDRVATLLGEGYTGGWPHISTFHSFCVRVLRHDITPLGYTRDFSIYDDDDQQRLVKDCIRQLSLEEVFTSPRAALSLISRAKNRCTLPEEMHKYAMDVATEKLVSVYDLYAKKLKQANALDFDDLLLKAMELFDTVPEALDWYNRHFTHILVDEYQDTNNVQYRLIRQLTRTHSNVFAVGDEDQSIYSWRGADIQNILSFERDFPQAKVIRLEQNYRSTQIILDAASAVVGHNTERLGKSLWSDRSEGRRVSLFEALTAEEEAAFVADYLTTALAQHPEATVGVLYRTNAQSRLLEEAMRRAGIRYRVVGGTRFYARAEVKDVLAYARLAANPNDDAALLRIINTPTRGIGATTVATLQTFAAERSMTLWQGLAAALDLDFYSARAHAALQAFSVLMQRLIVERDELKIGDFFRVILDRTGYIKLLEAESTPEADSRIENLQELVNAAIDAGRRGETLSAFLDVAALASDTDELDENARVTLMTLHTAKGLEFSTVFLVGLEEGLFPHKLSLANKAGIEEERRLCYVGMTRARDRLIISWSASRRAFRDEMDRRAQPSRFLAEIPRALTEDLRLGGAAVKARTRWENALNDPERIRQTLAARAKAAVRDGKSRWKIGARVRHPKFGTGTVIGCEGEGEDAKVTISFPGFGMKKMIERFSSLTQA